MASARQLQLCVKAILVGLRTQLAALPPPLEWARSFKPQGDTQTSSARLEEIARYKVAYLLLQKVAAVPNAKSTSLFGRDIIRWTHVWGAARTHILEENSKTKAVPATLLTRVVDTFGDSLISGEAGTVAGKTEVDTVKSGVRAGGTGAGGGESKSNGDRALSVTLSVSAGDADTDLSKLIWANDLGVALKARQEERRMQAAARVQEEWQQDGAPSFPPAAAEVSSSSHGGATFQGRVMSAIAARTAAGSGT